MLDDGGVVLNGEQVDMLGEGGLRHVAFQSSSLCLLLSFSLSLFALSLSLLSRSLDIRLSLLGALSHFSFKFSRPAPSSCLFYAGLCRIRTSD